MGLCGKRFGYESPAVGTWCIALSLQLVTGIIMLLIGYDKDIHDILEASSLTTNAYSVFEYMGLIHVALAILIAAVVALGLFVSPCFLCPLCIINIIESLYCVVSAATAGAYLQPYVSYVKHSELSYEGESTWSLADTYFARTNSGYILAAAVLALATLAAFSRANGMSNDTPIPEAQMYVPCVTLIIISGAIFIIGGGGEGYTVALGTIWFLLAIAVAIILNITHCCLSPKVCNVLVGAAFGCVAVVAIVSCIVATSTYHTVVKQVGMVGFPQYFTPPTEDIMNDYKIFTIMGTGKWLIVEACTSLACGVLAIFSTVYALRSVFSCCGKGE
ncbi:conserved hypothetical protein [Neospora caninum Liverpool]|uniref:Transmembrane protein n=1 Tax=Neospora caninum (strain Liverpool) TaxID=572307 RepID=F0VEV6_NEOCL|nr:conserved hypothetical protein [Neospora caninum Liverpool]CBZ52250.1 conserved hypothetical protein [Neospora caninum Liverpool]CEL66218.1 TPA: hypothetical protein BN1204_020370 [Neospora caninum Liverpool]|eukprot:XP_003882282.1 conserved hypothetical protein [Neospora caninum Liverpool]